MQKVIPTGKGQIVETKSAIKRGIEADSFAGLKDGCKNLVLITHWKIKPKQEVMMHTNDRQHSPKDRRVPGSVVDGSVVDASVVDTVFVTSSIRFYSMSQWII